jgi:Flp pilus assembly protein CpaB
MDKVIVTVILIVGGVVAAFAVFNGVYPAVERSGESISNAADTVNDRITSRIEIIQAGENGYEVDAWVKNVGSSRIDGIESSDIFLGPDGDIARVPFSDGGPVFPYWTYQLEGGNTQWGQATTNKITIHLDNQLTSGTYLLKMVIPNGIFDETVFSTE